LFAQSQAAFPVSENFRRFWKSGKARFPSRNSERWWRGPRASSRLIRSASIALRPEGSRRP